MIRSFLETILLYVILYWWIYQEQIRSIGNVCNDLEGYGCCNEYGYGYGDEFLSCDYDEDITITLCFSLFVIIFYNL